MTIRKIGTTPPVVQSSPKAMPKAAPKAMPKAMPKALAKAAGDAFLGKAKANANANANPKAKGGFPSDAVRIAQNWGWSASDPKAKGGKQVIFKSKTKGGTKAKGTKYQFTYNDACRLATHWGVSVGDAKSKMGKQIKAGKVKVLSRDLKAAKAY